MSHLAIDLLRALGYVVVVLAIIRVAIAPRKDGESS